MTNNEYIHNVLKTESSNFETIKNRVDLENIRLLHSFMGLCTESSEALDMLKKHLFYGKPLDKTNAIEEVGDCLWYIAIALDTLGVSFEEVMNKNIAKLKARYGNKFDESSAVNRDLKAEREILENKEETVEFKLCLTDEDHDWQGTGTGFSVTCKNCYTRKAV